MSPLCFWTLMILLYQTVLWLAACWLTLGCRLAPAAAELHELTLLKLLYLYEPEACGRVHFLNYTVRTTGGLHVSTIAWPETNPVAASFRDKVRLAGALQAAWLALAAARPALRRRPAGLYLALLPFCGAGLAVLLLDLLHAALFLRDLEHSSDEHRVLEYIGAGGGVRWARPPPGAPHDLEDTSWAAALMAYVSCRGVLQWIINFWILKDNYFEGLAAHRRLQSERLRRKRSDSG